MINPLAYPKAVRLLQRRQFTRTTTKGVRRFGKMISIEICPNGLSLTRLGITASRHFGIAVKRNRFKRTVREAFRRVRRELPSGLDIVVKPKSQAQKAVTDDLVRELLALVYL